MRRRGFALLALAASVACSIPGLAASRPQPTPTPTELPPSPTSTTPPLPPSPTPVPPSPTPQPEVISAGNVGRLSVGLSFGKEIVRSVAFSPDGSVLAAAEADPAASIGTVYLYDTASGERVRTLEGHTSAVWGLTFSPDGRYLATAGRDHTARVWDWTSGSVVHVLDFPNEVVGIAFSPDSRTLAVGGVDQPPGQPIQDAAIWTFAVDDWAPLLKLAEYWNIADVAFTPDGSRIVGGGTSRNVRVWRASDGAEQFILYHAGQVGSLDVSPDGATLATTLCEASSAGQCTRGAVWLWSLDSGRLLRKLSDFGGGMAGAVYSADGSALIAAGVDGTIRAYATDGYGLLLATAAPEGPYERSISDLAISADGRFLATGGPGRIDLWRVGP